MHVLSLHILSDYKKLESLQLQMARAILKAPRNTPSAALLGDLGWDTIESIHNTHKIKYFHRLINMESHRWPKLLFNAIYTVYNNDNGNLRWKWLDPINCTLVNCGLTNVLPLALNIEPSWLKSYVNLSSQ